MLRQNITDLPVFYRKITHIFLNFTAKHQPTFLNLTQNITRLVIYLLYYIALFPSFTQHLAK